MPNEFGPGELEILRCDALALPQDLGRPGWAHVGVTRSGAADRRSHRLANRLLANPEGHATIEVTMGRFSARVRSAPIEVAVTGAQSNPTVNGIRFGINSIRRVNIGETITLEPPKAGVRSYLAVRGGIAVDPTLGSRSYDTMSRIGPQPLRAGDVLPLGDPPLSHPIVDLAAIAVVTTDPVEISVMRGPHDDWLVDASALTRTHWQVSAHSDRIGIRLAGDPLIPRWPDRQLPSEGASRGAIQVPPNGQPVILGPDHPVTGGYPVVGVVLAHDCDKIAQVRPGQTIRLRWTPPSW